MKTKPEPKPPTLEELIAEVARIATAPRPRTLMTGDEFALAHAARTRDTPLTWHATCEMLFRLTGKKEPDRTIAERYRRTLMQNEQ